MFEELIIKKAKSLELTQAEFYEVIDHMLKNGANNNVIKFFATIICFIFCSILLINNDYIILE